MPKKTRYSSKTQSAGGYGLPLEYFGQYSDKYYDSGHTSISPPKHLKAVSYGIHDQSTKTTGPNLEAYHHKLNDNFVKQKGGSLAYDKIVNPATNRKVGIHTKLGRKILKNYLSQIN